jgi:hypothetical protein
MAGISGCETSQADAIISVRDYFAALERGDGNAACTQLTAAAVAELEARLGTSCGRAVLRVAVAPATLRDAKVDHAAVVGSTAVVEVVLFGSDPTVPLRTRMLLIRGNWKIADPYSPYSVAAGARLGR